jgi:hypothetical protein
VRSSTSFTNLLLISDCDFSVLDAIGETVTL